MARVIKNPSGYHVRGSTAAEKAEHFGLYVKEHGWKGKWSIDEESGILHLFARRDENETIDIWWLPTGAAHPDMLPVYSLAGERIKCRNVSAAAALAVKQPDENRRVKAVRKQKRQMGIHGEQVTQETIDALAGSLPFDHESTDEELKDALIGRTIVWVNRWSGDTDTAEISTDPKHFEVNRNGHDYINFVYPIPQRVLARFGKEHMECDTYGFRSVYLDSIVRVD